MEKRCSNTEYEKRMRSLTDKEAIAWKAYRKEYELTKDSDKASIAFRISMDKAYADYEKDWSKKI